MRRRSVPALALILVVPLATWSWAQSGLIAKAVEEAKRSGRSAVEVLTMSEPIARSSDLASWARGRSVILAARETVSPMAALAGDSIYTWYTLHVLKQLAVDRKPDAAMCRLSRPANLPALQPDQIAAPVFGGTVSIDGVQVTMVEGESHVPILTGRQRYVLVGDACPDSVFYIEEEFPVAADDRILSWTGMPIAPTITVRSLERWFASK